MRSSLWNSPLVALILLLGGPLVGEHGAHA
jgi:hypothetical protein